MLQNLSAVCKGTQHLPPPPPLHAPTHRVSSWGLTLPILELSPALGGKHLPQPRTFLLWHHAAAFIAAQREPLLVPAVSRRHFRVWATTFGVPLNPTFMLWLQLGPIPWKTYPFLGKACKAFSLLHKAAPVALPPEDLARRLPPWHSCLFRDTNTNAYYSPRLIRAGLVGWLVGWLVGSMVGWLLVGCLIVWFVVGLLVGCLVGGSLPSWRASVWVGWLVVGWLIVDRSLVCWLVVQLLFGVLVGRLLSFPLERAGI